MEKVAAFGMCFDCYHGPFTFITLYCKIVVTCRMKKKIKVQIPAPPDKLLPPLSQILQLCLLQKEDPDSGTESDRDWSNAANVRDGECLCKDLCCIVWTSSMESPCNSKCRRYEWNVITAQKNSQWLLFRCDNLLENPGKALWDYLLGNLKLPVDVFRAHGIPSFPLSVMIFALNAGKMLYVHQSLFSNQFTDHRVPPVSNMCPATAILQPHGISDSSQGLSCCFSDCDDNSDSELISINYKSGHLTPESEDDDEDWELEEIFTQSEINRCHAQRQCVSSGRNRLSVDEGFLDDSPEPLQFSNTPPEGLSHCYTLSPQEFLACSNVPISPLTHQHWLNEWRCGCAQWTSQADLRCKRSVSGERCCEISPSMYFLTLSAMCPGVWRD